MTRLVTRLQKQHRALLRKRRARLIERERENGDAAFVELTALGLLDRSPQDDVGLVLQPIEFINRLHLARSLDELQQTMELTDALGVLVRSEIAENAGERRADNREDQEAVEDSVAVFVEKLTRETPPWKKLLRSRVPRRTGPNPVSYTHLTLPTKRIV